MDAKPLPSTKKRRYQQLCPVARGLNHVGDRWALLILRDLHSGPARFRDLQTGLTGIATNLLTTRLQELQESGLIQQRETEFGVRVYELTELGQETEPLIIALAKFGAQFAPDEDLRPPGNLRLLSVPLKMLFQNVVDKQAALDLQLMVDEQPFAIQIARGQVSVRMTAAPGASVSLACSLSSILALMEDRLEANMFLRDELRVVRADDADLERVTGWIQRASSN